MGVHWLVFDAEAVTHVDASGREALDELIRDLHDAGIGMAVARLKTRSMRHFDNAGLIAAIGAYRFYPTVQAAADACA